MTEAKLGSQFTFPATSLTVRLGHRLSHHDDTEPCGAAMNRSLKRAAPRLDARRGSAGGFCDGSQGSGLAADCDVPTGHILPTQPAAIRPNGP
jgi:hypothetical protein